MTGLQTSLGPDGQLLDASKIEWYNDPDQMMTTLICNLKKVLCFNILHFKIAVVKAFICQVSAHVLCGQHMACD